MDPRPRVTAEGNSEKPRRGCDARHPLHHESQGQKVSDTPPTPPRRLGLYHPGMTPSLNVVGLVVTDMARSLAFYRKLGLDIPALADNEAHVQFTLPGGIEIAWDTVEVIRSFDPDWESPTGGALIALGFGCGDADEVDRVFAELVQAGYHGHKAPWDAFWGQRYAIIHDPDGNAIDLYAAVPARP
jgi:catechol 2,3-dioxygenase-like lactoylglutathione lyase family enzyme